MGDQDQGRQMRLWETHTPSYYAAQNRLRRLQRSIDMAVEQAQPPPGAPGWDRFYGPVWTCMCVEQAASAWHDDGWAPFEAICLDALLDQHNPLGRSSLAGALRSARDSFGLLERSDRPTGSSWRLTAAGHELLAEVYRRQQERLDELDRA